MAIFQLNARILAMILRHTRVLFLASVLAAVCSDANAANIVIVSPDHPSGDFTVADGNLTVLGGASEIGFPEAQERLLEALAHPSPSKACPSAGCWIAVIVENGWNVDKEYIPEAEWNYIDVWVEHGNGMVEHLRPLGNMAAPRSPTGAADHFDLLRGEQAKVIVRLANGAHFPTGDPGELHLQRYTKSLEGDRNQDLLLGLVAGGLMSLGLYNLLVALISRSRSYYWYCSYLFFMSISATSTDSGSVLVSLIAPNTAGLGVAMEHTADCMMWVSLLGFARTFLNTRKHIPWFDWIWGGAALIVFSGLVAGVLGAQFWVYLAYTGFSLPAPVGITASIICLRKGYRPAWYFLAGQLVVASGEILQTLQDFNFLNFGFAGDTWAYLISNRAVWIGSLLEAVLFSLALADRVKSLTNTVSEQTISYLRDRELLVSSQKEKLERDVAERTAELQDEKQKSDRLLLSVLPAEIAAELKSTGTSRPRRYDDASILFTDFRNFTTTVSALPAARLVDELNEIFQQFDDILLDCGVEKIKTIGDAYLVASGIPEAAPDHAARCVKAALRMLEFIAQRNQSSSIKWAMRAGIHSGSVVAGIVGKTKFAFDVFGDTVNIASRMESSSEPGRLNVSAYTYDLVKNTYLATYRGKVDIKGKGEIDMYFIDRARADA